MAQYARATGPMGTLNTPQHEADQRGILPRDQAPSLTEMEIPEPTFYVLFFFLCCVFGRGRAHA